MTDRQPLPMASATDGNLNQSMPQPALRQKLGGQHLRLVGHRRRLRHVSAPFGAPTAAQVRTTPAAADVQPLAPSVQRVDSSSTKRAAPARPQPGGMQAAAEQHRAAGQGYLSGNFAPVTEEVFETNLPIEGFLPPALEGVFIRNGPNPRFAPDSPSKYHWFDGDGMLHAVRIDGGRASYCNAYVHTTRLAKERAAGRSIFSKLGELRGVSGALRVAAESLQRLTGGLDPEDAYQTANTALLFHSGRLMALQEQDLPYRVLVSHDGRLTTVGREHIDCAGQAFTAHPKVDPETGELLFFGADARSGSMECVFGSADASGCITHSVAVPLERPVLMHDFAVTSRHAVFVEGSLVMDPSVMVKHNTLPMVYDNSRPARIGLLRRDAADAADMQWFEVPPTVMFHTANAWEDGDEVHLYGCCMNVAMLRALLDVNLVVRHAEGAERSKRVVGNILPLVLPSRDQHRRNLKVIAKALALTPEQRAKNVATMTRALSPKQSARNVAAIVKALSPEQTARNLATIAVVYHLYMSSLAGFLQRSVTRQEGAGNDPASEAAVSEKLHTNPHSGPAAHRSAASSPLLQQLPPPRNPAPAAAGPVAAAQPVTQTVLSVSAAVGAAPDVTSYFTVASAAAADPHAGADERARTKGAAAVSAPAEAPMAASCTAQVGQLAALRSTAGQASSCLYEFTLNMRSGAVSQRRVSSVQIDFPQVPADRVGRCTRFVYAAELGGSLSTAIVKIDLQASCEEDSVIGRIEYGPGRTGGEALFVPRRRPSRKQHGEDDGYLLSYVYDDSTGASELAVFCAKTMSAVPVARIALPQRVPYGFHSVFITQQDLATQLPV